MEGNEIKISELARLEKRQGDENTIYALADENGELKEGTDNVMNIVYNFYEDLYSEEIEDEDIQNRLLKNIDKKVSDVDKDKLDKRIEINELKEALGNLQNNKSPGSDGLTKEFYLYFWDDLQIPYKKMLDEVKRSKNLTNSQKKGIIRVIYKKNGRTFIKNYRPITLLNVDLIFLTRTLAKRLSGVLEGIIHQNQTAMNGRHISRNLHVLQDVIDVINNEDGEAALIFLDQEKAFDRMSHKFLFKTLKEFGIGENFIDWIKIIYNDTKSSVKINGFLTKEFDIKRGVRQGCPLSALLYVLCAEVLGVTIRKHPGIEGYKYNEEEHKGPNMQTI